MRAGVQYNPGEAPPISLPHMDSSLSLLVGRQNVEHHIDWVGELTLGTPSDIPSTGLPFRWGRPGGRIGGAGSARPSAEKAQWQFSTDANPALEVTYMQARAGSGGRLGAVLPRYGDVTLAAPGGTADFTVPPGRFPADGTAWVRVVLSGRDGLQASPWVKVTMAGAQAPVVINEEDPVIAPPLRVLGPAEMSVPLQIKLSNVYVDKETEDVSPEDEIFVVMAIADLTPPAGNELPFVNVVVTRIYDFDHDEIGNNHDKVSWDANIRIWGPAPIWEAGVLIMASVVESDGDFPPGLGESVIEAALREELRKHHEGGGWNPDGTMCNLMKDLVGDDDYIRSATPGRIGSCNTVWGPSEEDLKQARDGEEVDSTHTFERASSDDPIGWNSPFDDNPDNDIPLDDSRYWITFTLSK